MEIRCTGVCSRCGRCNKAARMQHADNRKTKMMVLPDTFIPDMKTKGYGVCFDIGTTTAAGILCNLETGEIIDKIAKTNPQIEFGMDVISRITFCSKDGRGTDFLRKKITDCINEIIDELSDNQRINSDCIIKAVICGNTAMSHIFAGYNPYKLAKAPFTAEYEGALTLSQRQSMLKISKTANVLVLPNIAGHIGGDITAGIIATGLLEKKHLTLFIDIGTNGEIVITDGIRSFACSAAAGPAFEGAAVLHGMRAADGAIERIIIEEGNVYFHTIGECQPKGLCGSGIIDGVAQLLKAGIIDKTGRMLTPEKAKARKSPYAEHIAYLSGLLCFTVGYGPDGQPIVITQKDIREVQLAKGAVAAGIKLLLDEMEASADDIKQLIVAGAFGNYIDVESAVSIGLLPDIKRENITFAGNTAGIGAAMTLMSERELDKAVNIPDRIEYVELSDKENFQDVFIKSMEF